MHTSKLTYVFHHNISTICTVRRGESLQVRHPVPPPLLHLFLFGDFCLYVTLLGRLMVHMRFPPSTDLSSRIRSMIVKASPLSTRRTLAGGAEAVSASGTEVRLPAVQTAEEPPASSPSHSEGAKLGTEDASALEASQGPDRTPQRANSESAQLPEAGKRGKPQGGAAGTRVQPSEPSGRGGSGAEGVDSTASGQPQPTNAEVQDSGEGEGEGRSGQNGSNISSATEPGTPSPSGGSGESEAGSHASQHSPAADEGPAQSGLGFGLGFPPGAPGDGLGYRLADADRFSGGKLGGSDVGEAPTAEGEGSRGQPSSQDQGGGTEEELTWETEGAETVSERGVGGAQQAEASQHTSRGPEVASKGVMEGWEAEVVGEGPEVGKEASEGAAGSQAASEGEVPVLESARVGSGAHLADGRLSLISCAGLQEQPPSKHVTLVCHTISNLMMYCKPPPNQSNEAGPVLCSDQVSRLETKGYC